MYSRFTIDGVSLPDKLLSKVSNKVRFDGLGLGSRAQRVEPEPNPQARLAY